MTTYQTYGVDASGRCTHAGPKTARRMNTRTAWYIQRSWERWRERYLREHSGDYPLRSDTAPTVALRAHPLGKPGECREYMFRRAGKGGVL